MNLKRTTSALLHRLGYLTHASTWRARKLKVGRILIFHGVGDGQFPAAEFEAHLRYLKCNFKVISLGALLGKLDSTADRLAGAIVLTFDDGLRNNFTAAYPILQRLNLPATFFVCPSLVEHQRWLWNQEARARLHTLSHVERKKLVSRWETGTGKDIEATVEWMKTLPLDQRYDRERELRELTGHFQASVGQRTQCDIMNWDELRALNPQLITIGSHTASHPILPTLSPDQLRLEVAESRRSLEAKLGREVEYFCYPNGAFNSAVVEQTRKVYKAAVAGRPGFVTSATDRYRLPRIGSTESLPLLAWRMHRPTA